jgi:hypothetical protein
MSMPTNERQPLLEGSSSSKKHAQGPQDISRSNRFGILAGVWMATFLAVSFVMYVEARITDEEANVGLQS